MKHLTLAALLLVAAFSVAAAADPPAMPVATVADLGAVTVLKATPPVPWYESEDAGFVTVFQKEGTVYNLLLYRPKKESPKFILIEQGDGEDTSTWGGVVEENRFVVTDYALWSEWLARFPQARDYFLRRTT